MGQSTLTAEASRPHTDTPHSVELLWTSDQPHAETYASQHSQQIDIHAPDGIRTRNPVIERPQTQSLDRATTGIGKLNNEPLYSKYVYVIHGNWVYQMKENVNGQLRNADHRYVKSTQKFSL